MGSADKNMKNLYAHVSQHRSSKHATKVVPKGYMAIKVGRGEEHQRFVVPVDYFNHPQFLRLLKEAEEEYGFDQKGTITIPCHVEDFRRVQGMIDRERFHHLPHGHQYLCFRV